MTKLNWAGTAVALCAAGCSAATTDAAAPASPEQESILQVVDEFFIALASADADAMERLVAPTATTVIVRPEGEQKVTYRNFADTIAQMRGGQFPTIIEPYWEPVVLERSGLAVVWTPYSVDVNGARIHCGVDVFNMSKHESGWKIDSINYTAEPNACGELTPPAGTPTRPDFSVLDTEE